MMRVYKYVEDSYHRRSCFEINARQKKSSIATSGVVLLMPKNRCSRYHIKARIP